MQLEIDKEQKIKLRNRIELENEIVMSPKMRKLNGYKL